MVSGERLTLTLTGGAPWGFRLQGGGGFPLEVAKIRKRSSANEADLREGDVVLTINGYPISGKSHQSAMDVVDMAGDKLVFEVARSGRGPSKPMDPQRQTRIIPPESGQAHPGMISSAQASYTTTDGNVRTDVNTEAFVVKAPGGKKITKTVTQERVTRYPTFVSPEPGARNSFVSPEPGSTRSFVSPEPGSIPSFVSPEPSNRSFMSPEPFSTPSPRPASSASLQPGGHMSRSPNRSPLMWKPQSLSPDNRANIPQSHSQPASLNTTPAVWQPRGQGHSPSPVAPFGSHSTPEPPKQPSSQSQSGPSKKSQKKGGDKENEDPIMLSEQAKWEARYGPANVPKFSLDNFGSNTWGGRGNKKNFIPKKIDDDPNYPMFGVPKISWHAPLNTEPLSEPELDTKSQKVPPPVPPKPSYSAPSPIPFKPEEQVVAGMEYHRPGMIRPPAQPNVKPAPPPPPMPPAPEAPSFGFLPKPRGFEPGYASTPGKDEPDHHRPDHLPVFGPKVMFVPDEDSGLPMSPDKSDHLSDISSLAKKKVFSDSAFYADASHKYPTIDEQMSMCKRIAESLTSAANTRARGARMFAKRKRKADKWVHDQHPELFGFRSEYSSSTGDVADLHDLDSELYFEDGGAKPLFSFRIPKIAGQFTEGQKMSMSKEEFERLRLAAPRVDHHAVSPNVCFSIAADLHKGGKNRGAKLFAKRQARVERFVIDESNVQKPPMETRLEHIIQSPQAPMKPSPWEAASQGNMGAAFNRPTRSSIQPPSHGPRHDLTADNHPSVLQGGNYNRKARGWQSGPAHSQQNFYRDGEGSIGSDEFTAENQQIQQTQWNTQPRPSSPIFEDSIDGDPYNIQFGDYNRRIKAWPGSGAPSQSQMSAPPQAYNYSAQPNYNSLPKGFSYSASRANQSIGMCDL